MIDEQYKKILYYGKLKKIGDSHYILLPKKEYKRVRLNQNFRIEIIISEVN
jgi:hypothetical protein